ncbi:MAG: MarC family protein [Planctomycetota bacterium]|nr:MarC family protein [Planctomycetota bacterium]
MVVPAGSRQRAGASRHKRSDKHVTCGSSLSRRSRHFSSSWTLLGCVPIFISLTSGMKPRERSKTAIKAVIAAGLILTLFLITGRSLFAFFGTSMGAFSVAGGILLFLIAMNMLRVQRSGFSQTVDAEMDEQDDSDDFSTSYPLALPLLAGPSAIATVIVLLDDSSENFDYGAAIVVAALVLVMLATFVILRLSAIVNHLLGTKGLLLAMRLMGLILAAVSVQFIADGIMKLFPFLASAAH